MRTRELERKARKFIKECIKEFDGNVVEGFLDEDKYKSEYIGTVFNIMPSGKYYMPWACSNLNPCPTCKGSGKKKKPVPCSYCSGTGIRFVKDFKQQQENVADTVKRLQNNGHSILFNSYVPIPYILCNMCNGEKEVQEDCSMCNGMGSREAYEDQIYMEILEQVSEKKGFWIKAGEGDPCDLFLCTNIEEKE